MTNSFLKIIIPLSAAAVISRTFDEFSLFYYLLIPLFIYIIFSGYRLIFKDKKLKNIIILILLFGLWAGLTSLWSSYPEISLMRAVYFIFISTGAVLAGYLWLSYNNTTLSFLLASNIIVILLSVFSLLTNIPSDSWTGGNEKGFMGFAGHQNTLASAILFTVPSVFEKILNKKLQLNYKWMLFNLLLMLNLFFLVLSYSRGAILSLLAAVVCYLILTKKLKELVYSLLIGICIITFVWFVPSAKKMSVDLLKKDFPGFLSSREEIWEKSFVAAKSGNITGLGYGISHPKIFLPLEPLTGSHYSKGRFIREKGNSILAIVEETGLIGLLFLLSHLIYIIFLYKNNNKHLAISLSSIIAFFIHSQFEAWWVGVGSIQLPIYFFFLGSYIVQSDLRNPQSNEKVIKTLDSTLHKKQNKKLFLL